MKIKFVSVIATMAVVLSFASTSVYAALESVDNVELKESVFEIGTPEAPNMTKSWSIDDDNDKVITYYPQYLARATDVSTAATEKYSTAISWYTEQFAENNGKEFTLDSEEFQEFVFSTMPDEGSGDIYSDLIDFQIFLDYYENAAKNQKIASYVERMQTVGGKGLSEREHDELMFLLPMNPASPTQYQERTADEGMETKAYSTSATVSYARTWAYKTNNTGYPYYAGYNGVSKTNNYMGSNVGKTVDGKVLINRPWNDCTNFVSQCLKAGGLASVGNITGYSNYKYWFYNNTKPSHTWGGANNMCDHLNYRIGAASYTSDLQAGDAVFADFNDDGDANHGAIITRVANGKEYLTAHTSDKKESNTFNGSYTSDPNYLGKWFETGYTVWGFEIDQA